MSNHPFRPLRRRAVRLVWGAGMVSDVGTWVQLIVVGSLVARESNSALLTGLTALATIAPQGMCAPIGGLLADKFDRRKVFIAGLAGQATMTMVLAVLVALGMRNPLLLSAVILCSSAAGSLGAPAYSSMLPDLVPAEELMAMVSLGIYSWNSGRIIGPLLATVAAGAVGPAWTIAFNSLTFGAMALSISLLRRPFLPPGSEATTVRARLAEGWRAVGRTPGAQVGIAMITLLNLCVAAFMGLIPIYAKQVFEGGTGLAGVLSALQGAGAIIGSLGVTVLAARLGRSRVVVGVVTLIVVSYVAYAAAPNVWWAGAAVIGLGAGSSSFFVTGFSIVQRDAPDAERGRVLSIAQAAMGSCYGIGIVWIGLVGDTLGLRAGFFAGAAALALLSLLLVRALPFWRDAVDGTPPRSIEVTVLTPGEVTA